MGQAGSGVTGSIACFSGNAEFVALFGKDAKSAKRWVTLRPCCPCRDIVVGKTGGTADFHADCRLRKSAAKRSLAEGVTQKNIFIAAGPH